MLGNEVANQRFLRNDAELLDIAEVDRLGPGDNERQALEQHHHAQRGDEWRNLHLGDHRPVDRANKRAGQNRRRNAQIEGQFPVNQHHTGHDRAEGHQGTDRQVNTRRNDDERTCNRQDAVNRRRLQDAHDVLDLHEARATRS